MSGPDDQGGRVGEGAPGGGPALPDGYPAAWACDVVLADGGTLHVRPVRPDDGEALVAMHGRMSKQSLYFRYFSARSELPAAEVERFTHVDYTGRMGLVAWLGDELIGFASYARLSEHEAEAAFTIEDAHQGRGLGTLLLEHLAAYARTQGIDHFVAEVLPDNHRMLGVFHDAGFVETSRLESGVARVALAISPTAAAVRAAEKREWRAESRSVHRLLHPRSVAVIGAGRRPGSVGHEILRNLTQGGFAGPVYPVHPSAERILGLPAWPDVGALPEPVDLAVVAVPAERVRDAVEACAARGVGSLVVVTAGFAETGEQGAVAEREVVSLARRSGMRLVGPNCLGVLNASPDVRLNATFGPPLPEPGRTAFLSQSGALGIGVLQYADARGLGVSSFASVGNKADLSGNDFLEYWEQDPDTDVVLLYLESFGNPRKFARVARRVSRRKPIVAVKAGRSVAGSRAASSHTAALASPDGAVEALFRQSGVIRVDTFEAMLDVAQLLAHQPLPEGPRVAIVGNSGGPGILAADACEASGLTLPELSASTQGLLRGFLPAGAAVANPVDLIASAAGEAYERALRCVLADPAVDAVIAIFTPTPLVPPEEITEAIARVAASEPGVPIVANLVGVTSAPKPLVEAGVPCFPFPESAARALAAVATYATWRARPEGVVPELPDIDRGAARRLVRDALTQEPHGCWLSAERAAALLGAYGIPIARSVRVDSADAAERAARELGGTLVLKAASPTLVHKTDVGGVALELQTPEAVRAAFERMHDRLGVEMGGGLLQPQLEAGVETIVGVVSDPSFGPLVLFGMGGTTVELQRDRALRILPLDDRDAHELVRSLRASPLLFGYRGAPPCDVGALEKLLLRIARLASDLPEVAELDLNPVIVGPAQARAVDAKIRLAPWERHPELAVRRLP